MVEYISVDFYINDMLYANRMLCIIPRIGDEVRFKGIIYTCIWIFDESRERICIIMEPIE